MISRSSKGVFSEWWWTVDRVSFFIVLALIGIGVMLSVAASPTVYGNPHVEGNFIFAIKQIIFAGLAIGIIIGLSLLPPEGVQKAARILFFCGIVGLVLVMVLGEVVYHARRWINLGFLTLQPSEFIKPAFTVFIATLLSSSVRMRYSKPVMSFIWLLPVVLLLLLEPDVGQTFLLLGIWVALLFFTGTSMKWLASIGAAAVVLGVLAYFIFPHVHSRIHTFLFNGDIGYQTGLSLRAFAHGGLLGAGPGAGTVKYLLPEAHSDYIFSVAGEEFGFVLCFAIALGFCVLVVRTMLRAAEARDAFTQLAGAGLAVAVALQAFINMGMTISLLPPKGMTLPFVSYGGSSLLSVAITMGFALALTRKRPPQLSPVATPTPDNMRGAW